jgi:hypothetical protein
MNESVADVRDGNGSGVIFSGWSAEDRRIRAQKVHLRHGPQSQSSTARFCTMVGVLISIIGTMVGDSERPSGVEGLGRFSIAKTKGKSSEMDNASSLKGARHDFELCVGRTT